jgi:hypothetical protein
LISFSSRPSACVNDEYRSDLDYLTAVVHATCWAGGVLQFWLLALWACG